jgi:hypothetical protein
MLFGSDRPRVYGKADHPRYYRPGGRLDKRRDALLLAVTDQGGNRLTPGQRDIHDSKTFNRSNRPHLPRTQHWLLGTLHPGLAVSIHSNPTINQPRRIITQKILQHDDILHLHGNLLRLLPVLLNGVCPVNCCSLLVLPGVKKYSLWI